VRQQWLSRYDYLRRRGCGRVGWWHQDRFLPGHPAVSFLCGAGQWAKTEAAKTGNTLYFVDANGDVTKQNNDIQDLITRGMKILIVNPVDPKGVAPSHRPPRRPV
jgi:hypothetical protein